MNLPRRAVLRAAAMSPAIVALPGLARTASASSGMAIFDGWEIDGEGIDGFSLSWIGEQSRPVARVSMLVDGLWSSPVEVHSDRDHGPQDAQGREHGNAVLHPGTERFRVDTLDGVDAHDLRVHLLKPTPQPLRLNSGGLTTVSPFAGLEVIERSNWTTRGRRDTGDCSLGSSVYGLGCRSDVGLRHAVIHHTVNVNDYSPEQVPTILRGIQSFHMDVRGWDDVAYNFIVDRFGRIWHGREGDVQEPITGGHTLGFNTESVGVAVLGTFSSTDPGQAVVDALSALLGWKLSIHGIDPLGSTGVRSTGGDASQPGEIVTVRNISGHRDNQTTSCPGDRLNDRIDEIRSQAAQHVPLFGTLTPRYSDNHIDVEGWAIERSAPTSTVAIDITIDGDHWQTISADIPLDSVLESYPHAGAAHGFSASVPITIDTRSVQVIARAGDGTTASLMDLLLFATFIDVQPHRFFAPGVYFLKENELTSGTMPGLFEPMDRMTRAQMATFLHRFMGLPEGSPVNPFDDVERDRWFTQAIDWLFADGITTGTSARTFSPGQWVTRGQMATFLWRLCGRQPTPEPHPFNDIPIGAYFEEPVRWMHKLELTKGYGEGTYFPDGTVTRGEIATFLERLARQPAAWTVTEPPFTFDD